MTVTQRVGESSYILTDSHGDEHDAHLSQLKACAEENLDFENTSRLEFHSPLKRTSPQKNVGEIIDRRITLQNSIEILVKWTHRDISEATWESPSLFVRSGLLKPLWTYCERKSIQLKVPDLF